LAVSKRPCFNLSSNGIKFQAHSVQAMNEYAVQRIHS